MTVAQTPVVAWKVLTAAQFETFANDRTTAGAPVDLADGFIHLSTRDQLEETLARHFAGQEDLRLVCVDLAALGDAVRWETAPSRGGELFPHIYGDLPLDVVIAYGPVDRDEKGGLRPPVAG